MENSLRLTLKSKSRLEMLLAQRSSLKDTREEYPMKIITPNLCGLIYLAVITISLNVGAAEFTCEVNQRNCLYDTVAAANQTTEPDVIRFSKGIHLTDMKALACAPAIVGDITIIGAGRIDTQLHATNSCAFFHVPKGSSLTLRDIFLANGRKAGPDLVLRGAAVYNEGLLNVERSYFISNTITFHFIIFCRE